MFPPSCSDVTGQLLLGYGFVTRSIALRAASRYADVRLVSVHAVADVAHGLDEGVAAVFDLAA